jgi:hypothetical protein
MEQNRRVNKILRWAKLARLWLISCDRCPPHRVENRERRAYRSWKERRKRQWKGD